MCQLLKKKEVRHFDKLVERLRRADAAVESEYAENDRRLSWTLIFHAFLFQAYATCLQTLDNNSEKSGVDDIFVWTIIFVICAVGTITAVITAISTRAAIDAICEEKNTRENIEVEAKEYGFESHGFPIKHPLHKRGLLPTQFFPSVLLIAWIIILFISIHQKMC